MARCREANHGFKPMMPISHEAQVESLVTTVGKTQGCGASLRSQRFSARSAVASPPIILPFQLYRTGCPGPMTVPDAGEARGVLWTWHLLE